MTEASPATPIAVLDVGTNTILQLVARRSADGELEVLDDACVTARLGEGLKPGGTLRDEALERAVRVVVDLTARAHELGVHADDVWAAGTAVLRRAVDADRFRDAVRERTGIEVDVLSEEDEARLGFLAVTGDGAGPNAWIVDVGGGSTEVAGDGGALRLSAPVGAVTLSAEHGATTGDDADFDRLYERARAVCADFPRIPADADLVALGGTASNLACLDLELDAYDPMRAEGHRLDATAALRHARRLWLLPLDERRALPIEDDRAEILPAGLACLAAAFERIGAAQARVSGRGLRYGMARRRLA